MNIILFAFGILLMTMEWRRRTRETVFQVQENEFPQDDEYPRIVWMYHSGQMKPGVPDIFNITKGNLKNWDLRFLIDENISLYLNSSLFPEEFHHIIPQHRSDFLRLCLLYYYGGWYIDTTVMINSDSFMEDALEEIKKKRAQLYGYCFLQCPLKNIESNVLYAPKHSSVMKAWKDEFESAIIHGETRYTYEVHRNGVDVPAQIFRPYPSVYSYLVIYTTQQAAFNKVLPRKPTIISYNSEDYIYQFVKDCEYDNKCIISSIKQQFVRPKYQVLKIFYGFRNQIWKGSAPNPSSIYKDTHENPKGIRLSSEVNQKASILVKYNILLFLSWVHVCYYFGHIYFVK